MIAVKKIKDLDLGLIRLTKAREHFLKVNTIVFCDVLLVPA